MVDINFTKNVPQIVVSHKFTVGRLLMYMVVCCWHEFNSVRISVDVADEETSQEPKSGLEESSHLGQRSITKRIVLKFRFGPRDQGHASEPFMSGMGCSFDHASRLA